jgi:hypothetical protein
MGPIEIFGAASGGGGGSKPEVFAGLGSPVGVVTADGPATYYDSTTPAVPITWIKTTLGTNNTDWVLSSSGAPATYPEVLLAARRAPSSEPGIAGTVPTSRATSRLVVGSVIDEDPGAGPLSFWCRFRVPASLATNAGICALSPSETHVLGGSGSNAIGLGIIAGDVNLFMGNSTTHTRYPLGCAGLVGQVVDIVVTRNVGLVAYVNGTAVTLTGVDVSGGVAANETITATWAHALAPLSSTISNSNNSIAGPITRFVAYNFALSAAEASSLIVNGVNPADQWGVRAEVMNATTLNGGFETAGVGGADVFATWTESTTGTSTINRDTTVFFEGTASARFDVDGSGSLCGVGQMLMPVGKRYRLTFAFRHNATPNVAPQIRFGAGFLTLPTAPSATWTQYDAVDITGEAVAINGMAELGFYRTFGHPGASFWFDAVVIRRLGAFLDLQFDGTIGLQAGDRANNRTATLYNGAGFTQPDSTQGFAHWVASVPGGERFGGSAVVVIPTNASISMVKVRNINLGAGRTFSLGDASGSLTNIINAAALEDTGTVTEIIPGATTSSTGQLWASYTGTGSVEITVYFERYRP